MTTFPRLGERIPASVLKRVVFPAPFGPRTTYTEGAAISKEMSLRTSVPRYPEHTERHAIHGTPGGASLPATVCVNAATSPTPMRSKGDAPDVASGRCSLA